LSVHINRYDFFRTIVYLYTSRVAKREHLYECISLTVVTFQPIDLKLSVGTVQSCELLKWIFFRFLYSCIPVPVNWNWNFIVISPYSAIFKKFVNSFEPGVSPDSKLCTTFLKIAKRLRSDCGTVAVRLIFQFTYVQYCT